MRSPFAAKLLSEAPLFSTPEWQVRGVGVRETMPPCYVARPGGTGDCFFALFHEEVEVGPQRQRVSPGTIILWFPGDAHYYGNPRRDWSHTWVHCDGVLVRKWLEERQLLSGQPVRLLHPGRVEQAIDAIRDDLTGHRPLDEQIMANNICNLVRECAREQRPDPQGKVPGALRLAKQDIESRYHECLSLDELARAANYSAPYFCQEFKRCFGVSPGAYWLRLRMDAAAVLLQDTDLDVSEIGRRVGCDDPYHFSRSFKKTFGKAPSHFRAARIGAGTAGGHST